MRLSPPWIPQFSLLALERPSNVTKTTMHRLRVVKILLILVERFTPMLRNTRYLKVGECHFKATPRIWVNA